MELAENVIFLLVGQFGTKLLSFFLVPIYTNILSTTEYGIYDIFNSTVGILISIFTLNICEAVMRFAMDRDADSRGIFAYGSEICFISCLLVAGILFINFQFNINAVLKEYSLFFFFLFCVQAASGIMTGFTRGIGKIRIIATSGVLSSSAIIIGNILFLCVFKMGLKGYFIANILGPFVQVFYLSMKVGIHEYIDWKHPDLHLKREMRNYCVPTIANSVAWWINGLSDRYILIWMCGVAENGVYSVASKIPSILNVFQSIFNQAWSLSAVKEFDREDRDGFFSNMYNMYNSLMVTVCSAIIVADRFLASVLYSKDFYTAWKYVPFLTIAIVFGAVSGYVGSIFLAMKRSDVFVKCSGTGAIVNILLNITLIPIIGAMGAAMATGLSYWSIYVVSVIYLKKNMEIKTRLLRDNVSYCILWVQAIVLVTIDKGNLGMYLIQIICFVMVASMYHKEVATIIQSGFLFLRRLIKRGLL